MDLKPAIERLILGRNEHLPICVLRIVSLQPWMYGCRLGGDGTSTTLRPSDPLQPHHYFRVELRRSHWWTLLAVCFHLKRKRDPLSGTTLLSITKGCPPRMYHTAVLASASVGSLPVFPPDYALVYLLQTPSFSCHFYTHNISIFSAELTVECKDTSIFTKSIY